MESEAHTNQAEIYHKDFLTTRKESLTDGTKLLKHISFSGRSGLKFLDLGCGTGDITYKLAELVGSKGQVIGVDPDKDRLEIARRNNTFPNLTFVEGDSATFPEDQYDLIFCHYATDLIKDKETLYKRVYENLRPGGQFACVAILQQSQLALDVMELAEPNERKEMDEMFQFYSEDKYDQLAKVNGFTVTLKENDIDVIPCGTPESVLAGWKAVTHGIFKPENVNKERLEEFKRKYDGHQMEWRLHVVRYILTKN